jgi:transposase-like protein
LDRPQRRRFPADEKRRILREAEQCTERGQLGALLRREGIYHSHLTAWRQQLEQAGFPGLEPRRPGPKPKQDAKDRRIAQLERHTARLERELAISRALVDLQRKAHEVLGIALPSTQDD